MKRLILRALAHTILAAADWADRSANWIAAGCEGNLEAIQPDRVMRAAGCSRNAR
jgi:hypothetical protein